MGDELPTNQIYFEKNLMPKLLEEYTRTEKIAPFNLEKVGRLTKDGGFGVTAWEGPDLLFKLETMLKKGWIQKVDIENYQLSELGKKWVESWSEPAYTNTA